MPSLVSLNDLAVRLGIERRRMEELSEQVGRHYRPFDLLKPGSKKWRHIDNPVDPLKGLQRRILARLLAKQDVPEFVLGAVPGRSIRDNAIAHVGQPALVTLDLSDCFPSIDNQQVHDTLCTRLGCGRHVAAVLTKLTTFQTRLPQGAPSSPTLANLVLLPMHLEILGVAEDLGLACTSFVDDVALSGPRAREAIEPVIKIIQGYGYAVNQKKKSVMSANACQVLTGTVVNQAVSAGRKRIIKIRQRIYELSTQQEAVTAADLRSIQGSIGQVKFLNSAQGEALSKYAARMLPGDAPEVETARQRPDSRRCRCTRGRHGATSRRKARADRDPRPPRS
jgi:hypothetical protein